MNFVYAEPATPAVREGGGRPRVLRATHRIGEPVKTKVNGMSGFVFFATTSKCEAYFICEDNGQT